MTQGTGDRVTREVERLLGGALDAKQVGRLGTALATLHRRFVAETPDDTKPRSIFGDRVAMAAYVAYFHPASVAQVRRALVEVAPPAASTLRVLDLGAGPGSASVAVAEWAAAHGRRVDVTALETAPLALETLPRLFPTEHGTVRATSWTAGAPVPAGPWDVIVASHAINELFATDPAPLERRIRFAADLAKLLTPGGLLVLVEPALRRTGRELLQIRDRLLTESGLVALAPCLYQGACPSLERPRDWCHADRPWTPPPLVDRVGTAAGLERASLKYSYLVLTNTPPDPARTQDASLFRIVSEALPEKGKLRFFGCGAAGRQALVRLERDATPANAAFGTLERGDVVRTENLGSSGDGRRIGKESPLSLDVSARDLDGK